MSDNCIKVAVRCRERIAREIRDDLQECWLIKDQEITGPRANDSFTFDYILGQNTCNADVYALVKPIVLSSVCDGINGTIFAYGQTSSGKTHSIMGSAQEAGIIPLAVNEIFNQIKESDTRKFLVRCSYMEIYNEKVRDLLNTKSDNVKVREDIYGNVTVNVEESITRTRDEMMKVVRMGSSNRQVGVTNMNERSSRSHVIFKIIIESSDRLLTEQVEAKNIPVKVASLYFVDLAGSERVAQSKATGVRLIEGTHINKSLSALSLVIRQLSDSQEYINFRDSKLTRLLSNALGGNSKTLILATITPVSLEDTLSTLQFASCAKKIVNKARVNELVSDAVLIKRQEQKERVLVKELNDEKLKTKSLELGQELKDQKIKNLELELVAVRTVFATQPPAKPVESIPRRRHTLGVPINSLPIIYEATTPKFAFELEEVNKQDELQFEDNEFDQQIVNVMEDIDEELTELLELPNDSSFSSISPDRSSQSADTNDSLTQRRCDSLEKSRLQHEEFLKYEMQCVIDSLEERVDELQKTHADELLIAQKRVADLEQKNTEVELCMSVAAERHKKRENELINALDLVDTNKSVELAENSLLQSRIQDLNSHIQAIDSDLLKLQNDKKLIEDKYEQLCKRKSTGEKVQMGDLDLSDIRADMTKLQDILTQPHVIQEPDFIKLPQSDNCEEISNHKLVIDSLQKELDSLNNAIASQDSLNSEIIKSKEIINALEIENNLLKTNVEHANEQLKEEEQSYSNQITNLQLQINSMREADDLKALANLEVINQNDLKVITLNEDNGLLKETNAGLVEELHALKDLINKLNDNEQTYSNQITSLQETINSMKAVDELKALADLELIKQDNSKIITLNEDIGRLKEINAGLIQELHTLKDLINELNDNEQTYSNQITSLEETINSMKAVDKLKALADLELIKQDNSQVIALNEDIGRLKEINAGLIQELHTLKDLINELNDNEQTYSNQITSLQETINSMKAVDELKALADLELIKQDNSQVIALNEDIGRLKETNAGLIQELHTLKDSINKLNDNEQTYSNQIISLQETINSMKAVEDLKALADLELIKQDNSQVIALNEDIGRLKEINAGLIQELHTLKDLINELNGNEQTYSNQITSLQETINSMKAVDELKALADLELIKQDNSQVIALNEDIGLLKETNAGLVEELHALKDLINKLNDNEETYSNQITSLQETINSMKVVDELKALADLELIKQDNSQVIALNEDIGRLKETNAGLVEELHTLKDLINKLNDNEQTYSNQITSLQETINSIKAVDELKALADLELIKQDNSQVIALNEDIGRLKETNAGLIQELHTLKDLINELNDNEQTYTNQITSLQETINSMKAVDELKALADLELIKQDNSKVIALNEDIGRLKETNAGLIQELDALKDLIQRNEIASDKLKQTYLIEISNLQEQIKAMKDADELATLANLELKKAHNSKLITLHEDISALKENNAKLSQGATNDLAASKDDVTATLNEQLQKTKHVQEEVEAELASMQKKQRRRSQIISKRQSVDDSPTNPNYEEDAVNRQSYLSKLREIDYLKSLIATCEKTIGVNKLAASDLAQLKIEYDQLKKDNKQIVSELAELKNQNNAVHSMKLTNLTLVHKGLQIKYESLQNKFTEMQKTQSEANNVSVECFNCNVQSKLIKEKDEKIIELEKENKCLDDEVIGACQELEHTRKILKEVDSTNQSESIKIITLNQDITAIKETNTILMQQINTMKDSLLKFETESKICKNEEQKNLIKISNLQEQINAMTDANKLAALTDLELKKAHNLKVIALNEDISALKENNAKLLREATNDLAASKNDVTASLNEQLVKTKHVQEEAEAEMASMQKKQRRRSQIVSKRLSADDSPTNRNYEEDAVTHQSYLSKLREIEKLKSLIATCEETTGINKLAASDLAQLKIEYDQLKKDHKQIVSELAELKKQNNAVHSMKLTNLTLVHKGLQIKYESLQKKFTEMQKNVSVECFKCNVQSKQIKEKDEKIIELEKENKWLDDEVIGACQELDHTRKILKEVDAKQLEMSSESIALTKQLRDIQSQICREQAGFTELSSYLQNIPPQNILGTKDENSITKNCNSCNKIKNVCQSIISTRNSIAETINCVEKDSNNKIPQQTIVPSEDVIATSKHNQKRIQKEVATQVEFLDLDALKLNARHRGRSSSESGVSPNKRELKDKYQATKAIAKHRLRKVEKLQKQLQITNANVVVSVSKGKGATFKKSSAKTSTDVAGASKQVLPITAPPTKNPATMDNWWILKKK